MIVGTTDIDRTEALGSARRRGTPESQLTALSEIPL